MTWIAWRNENGGARVLGKFRLKSTAVRESVGLNNTRSYRAPIRRTHTRRLRTGLYQAVGYWNYPTNLFIGTEAQANRMGVQACRRLPIR